MQKFKFLSQNRSKIQSSQINSQYSNSSQLVTVPNNKASEDTQSCISDTTFLNQFQETEQIIKEKGQELKNKLNEINNQVLLNASDLFQSSLVKVFSVIDGQDIGESFSDCSEIEKKINEILETQTKHKIETEKQLKIVSFLLSGIQPKPKPKPRVKKNIPQEISYYPPIKKPKISIPCTCVIFQSKLKTRSQVLREFNSGAIQCKCNSN